MLWSRGCTARVSRVGVQSRPQALCPQAFPGEEERGRLMTSTLPEGTDGQRAIGIQRSQQSSLGPAEGLGGDNNQRG